ITDSEDRKRLKSIVQDLDVPEGMGVILRTAGASRTKQEVRRDFEYLLRMWETVRELTLKSSAPTLVYEEGSLIKRAIRDLYNKDIEEIVVAGEDGYSEARDFMRMLMPTQTKSVISYRDPQPIFARHGVESQLDSMFSNQVTLKSGGYLVINQTEALVAIDVNSGRSTREHNIEDTALRTNLEASDEVARQLRLRDLAGLIVVDFIDMEEHRNNRSVERRLKEALKNDRARIQVGRISHFGLLEMSRQRIRTGVLEGSTVVCAHCLGSGTVRSTSSIALHVLRVLEDALIKSAAFNITVRTRTAVALYILNQKRAHVRDLEERFGVIVTVAADDTFTGALYHAIERGEPATSTPRPEKRSELVRVDSIPPAELEAEDEEEEEEEIGAEGDSEGGDEHAATANGAPGEAMSEEEAESQRRRRRRRRRRGRGADREGSGIGAEAPQPSDDALAVMAQIGGAMPGVGAFSDGDVDQAEAESEPAGTGFIEGADQTDPRRRRRRPRRGRGRLSPDGQTEETASLDLRDPEAAEPVELASSSEPAYQTIDAFSSPSPEPAPHVLEDEPATEADRPPSRAPAAPSQPDLPEAEPPHEKRSGWWQRAKATFGGA
ncbi:MAG TPA: Rne/Rng family ribonuclease, partial [Beijerinckiaceae bacterium]|nr:Rne/Rng family ribonuclease [Beijerinckiaceae bacterium]